MAKRGWWLLGAGLSAMALLTLASWWPVVNDVTTGETPEYPDLQPRRYALGPPAAFQAVRAAAAGMRGWRITAEHPAAGTLQAEARVLLTPFTDDVTVWVRPDDGGSRVVVRSHSRVGRGDLGVNARRIRAFLRALDQQLSSQH